MDSRHSVPALSGAGRWERRGAAVLLALCACIFWFLTLSSLLTTCVLDPARYTAEHILFQRDTLWCNLLAVGVCLALLPALYVLRPWLAALEQRQADRLLTIWVLAVGFSWIFSVTSLPAADSYNIFEAASGAARGDYTVFHDNTDAYASKFYGGYAYLRVYPHQLGMVFLCELLYRLTGGASTMPLQVVNVLCIAAAWRGLTRLTERLFRRRSVTLLATALLAGCIQPMLLTTFAYGNCIGLCAAVWAGCHLTACLREGQTWRLLPCGALLTVAILAKYNNLIWLAACVIVLLLRAVSRRDWRWPVYALCLVLAATGAVRLVRWQYAWRTGVDLGQGISQTLYLQLGLSESGMAPGWWNYSAVSTFLAHDADPAAADAAARQAIADRLARLGADPGYALDFFIKKAVSQWNEPTFECVWVSEVKGHQLAVGPLGSAVYDGLAGRLLESWCNQYVQLLYLLFAAGLTGLLYRRRVDAAVLLLPLVVLGGFGYHLLFEAKSQYAATYLPLLIPLAARAAAGWGEGAARWLAQRRRKAVTA